MDHASVRAFIRARSFSLLMVVAVLFVVVLAQAEIFFSLSFGRLEQYVPSVNHRQDLARLACPCGACSSPRASFSGC